MIKRILSVMLAASLMIMSAPTVYPAELFEEENPDVAYFKVSGEKIKTSNLVFGETYPNIAPKLIERDGRKGIWLSNSGGTNVTDIMLNFSEDFAYKVDDGTSFTVEIDYYAMGCSLFYLKYDAIDEVSKNGGIGQYLLDDVGVWKTLTIELSDAYFSDRMVTGQYLKQYDMALYASQSTTMLVSGVRVTRHKKQNALYVTNLKTVNVGNIFGNSEEQKFVFDVVNTTEKTRSGNLVYRVVTEDGEKVIWEGEDTVTVRGGETLRMEAVADCRTYGIFMLEAGIKGDGFEQKDAIPFSYVDTIEDGTKNGRFGWCQITATQFYPDEQLELASRTNAGFVRFPNDWSEIVTGNANNIVMKYPDRMQYFIDKLKAMNMGFLFGISCVGNALYDGEGGNRMPVEDYLRKPYLEYIDYIAKYLKEQDVKCYGWEFWNEPNLKKFNTNMATGTQYAELAKDVADKVHETWPGADFFTGSLTSLEATVTKNFYQEMLDADIGKHTNGIALHSYSHDKKPEVGLIKETREYIEKFEETYGYKPKVTCSELGYVTRPGSNLVYNDMELAKYNTRLYIMYAAYDLYDTFAWYMLADSGTNKMSMEDVFGQTEVGWKGLGGKQRLAAKESFVAITEMNKRLQDAYNERTVIDKNDTYAFLFRRPKDNTLVMPMWAPEGAKTFSFKCDASELTLYDMYGNSEIMYGKDGIFSITGTDSVQYIEGDLENLEIVDNPIEFSATDIIAPVNNNMTVSLSGIGHKGLTAEIVSASSEFDITESKTVFTETGANVSFKTPNREGAKTTVVIAVKDGEKLVYKWQIPIVLSAEVDLKVSTKSTASVDTWGMELMLTNVSTEPMTGTVTVTSPPELVKVFKPMRFNTIPAETSGKIVFSPQKLERIGLYPAYFRIETDSGKEFNINRNLDFSVADYAKVKPTIDGVINEEEWNYGSKLGTLYEEQVKFGALYEWKGTNDLSTNTMIKYDEDYFYMAVDVLDDVHVALPANVGVGNIWIYDSIQFGISFEHVFHDMVIGGSFTEISIGATFDGVHIQRNMTERNELPTGAVPKENYELAVTRDGMHTYYELKLPWSEITILDVDFDTLENLTFSMLVNDNDGNGRKGWMEYGSGIGSAKDVSLFTALKLVR